MDLNFYLFQIINGWAGQNICLDSLAIFFARYFEYILVFCLLLILFYPVKSLVNQGISLKAKLFNRVNWPMIWQAFLAAFISRFVFTEIIRWLYPVSRPFVENNVNLLFDYPNEPAFPSGHAAFYFALAAVVYFYNKKAGYLVFLSAFLISISRVFCGIHWPLDI